MGLQFCYQLASILPSKVHSKIDPKMHQLFVNFFIDLNIDVSSILGRFQRLTWSHVGPRAPQNTFPRSNFCALKSLCASKKLPRSLPEAPGSTRMARARVLERPRAPVPSLSQGHLECTASPLACPEQLGCCWHGNPRSREDVYICIYIY